MHHPEVVERLAILNAPHPRALQGGGAPARGRPLRSWYMGLLPAAVAAGVPRARRSSRSATTRAYREAWAQPGALTAMFNYYRAMTPQDADHARRRADAGDLGPHDRTSS